MLAEQCGCNSVTGSTARLSNKAYKEGAENIRILSERIIKICCV